MFHYHKNLLTPAEVQAIADIARVSTFVNGRASNPHNTEKSNLQADVNDARAKRATDITAQAIRSNPEIMDFVFYRRMALPLLHRYEPGMHYGAHSDAAFMAVAQPPLRSDISVTVFISPPETYEGGELVMHMGSERVVVKGEAGSAIFYPSTTLHEVTPVTSGSRVVMISFIESMIPDEHDREMLYLLNEVYALEGNKMEWNNRIRLQHVSQSLLRKWSK
jgi:PKHD-type hydroxylase